MKLTRRDKFILTIVLVILILVLGGIFFAKPKYEEIQRTKVELEEIQKKKAETEEKIGTLEPLREQLRGIVDTIDTLQENYFDEKETYETDIYMREILDKLRADPQAIDISTPVAEALKPYVMFRQNVVAYDLKMNSYFNEDVPFEVRDAYNNVNKKSPEGSNVYLTKYTYTIPNDLMKALKVCDTIEDDEKTMFIYSATAESGSDTESEATIVIYVVATRKMNTQAILDSMED